MRLTLRSSLPNGGRSEGSAHNDVRAVSGTCNAALSYLERTHSAILHSLPVRVSAPVLHAPLVPESSEVCGYDGVGGVDELPHAVVPTGVFVLFDDYQLLDRRGQNCAREDPGEEEGIEQSEGAGADRGRGQGGGLECVLYENRGSTLYCYTLELNHEGLPLHL